MIYRISLEDIREQIEDVLILDKWKITKSEEQIKYLTEKRYYRKGKTREEVYEWAETLINKASKDSPKEIENLIKSIGGSTSLLRISLGVDFLSEPVESKWMFEDFLNVKGVRLYVGAGFIPLKLEGHTSFLDYRKPFYETKYESYDEYYKTRSLPSQIRSYYDNYYNGGKKK